MITSELVEYVRKALESGLTIESITPALLGQGWSSEDVKQAASKAAEIMSGANNVPLPPKAPEKITQSSVAVQVHKNVSAAQVLLYLGAIVMVLAAVIYVGITWMYWNSGARIFAIFAPTFITFVIGAYLWGKQDKEKTAMNFLGVSAVIFPFMLMVIFNELKLFEHIFSREFNLTVASVSLVFYCATALVFRNQAWSIFIHLALTFVVYMACVVLGVQDAFNAPIMAWIMLVLGAIYTFAATYYDKRSWNNAAHTAYTLGSILSLFALLGILLDGISRNPEGNISLWLSMLAGVAYFCLGVAYERKDLIKYCSSPYFMGTMAVFGSVAVLAIRGEFLKHFLDVYSQSREIVGGSNFFAGIIFMLVGLLLSRIKFFGLKEGPKFSSFFDLVGPIWMLISMFYLGLGGHYPIYETALLLLCLIFIFGSVPTASRHHLFLGTVFLIIYIFDIGGEYFQNQVGWPLTLFGAGLISMGVGAAIEKMRRTFFTSKVVSQQ